MQDAQPVLNHSQAELALFAGHGETATLDSGLVAIPRGGWAVVPSIAALATGLVAGPRAGWGVAPGDATALNHAPADLALFAGAGRAALEVGLVAGPKGSWAPAAH